MSEGDPAKFFHVDPQIGDVSQGDLLIAEPFLDEDYFSRAVVAIIDCEKGGETMGLVLNNKAACTLADVLRQVPPSVDVPLYVGGPLAHDQLFFIHTLGPDVFAGSKLFAPGLYLGGDFDSIVDYVNSGYSIDGSVRFFVGYSGWAKGQLENELNNDVWAVSRMFDDAGSVLTGSGDEFWRKAVGNLGGAYRSWLLIPHDVRSN